MLDIRWHGYTNLVRPGRLCPTYPYGCIDLGSLAYECAHDFDGVYVENSGAIEKSCFKVYTVGLDRIEKGRPVS